MIAWVSRVPGDRSAAASKTWAFYRFWGSASRKPARMIWFFLYIVLIIHYTSSVYHPCTILSISLLFSSDILYIMYNFQRNSFTKTAALRVTIRQKLRCSGRKVKTAGLAGGFDYIRFFRISVASSSIRIAASRTAVIWSYTRSSDSTPAAIPGGSVPSRSSYQASLP